MIHGPSHPLLTHVVLVIYTFPPFSARSIPFSTSRLLFSQLFLSVRRGFHMVTGMKARIARFGPSAYMLQEILMQQLR